MLEDRIKRCIPCQATGSLPPPPPVQMRSLPNEPWQRISLDFWGPTPSNDYLLVLLDDHSRYPVIEITTSTAATAVIPLLDKVFSVFGIPEVLRTDNGPPFNSREFANFVNHYGCHHHRVTPRWPRANGEAERFMRNIKKIVQTAAIELKNWKQELYVFLRNYRATPHSHSDQPTQSLIWQRAKNQDSHIGIISQQSQDGYKPE